MPDSPLETHVPDLHGTIASPTPSWVLMGRTADIPLGAKQTTGWSLRGFAWLLGILFSLGAWVILQRYLPLPRLMDLFGYGVVVIVGWLIVRAIVNRRRSKVWVGNVPKKLDQSEGRLQAVGKNGQLARLKAMGEVRDETFEPIVLLAPKVIPMPGPARVVMIVTATVFCGLMVLLQKTTLPTMGFGWLQIMAGCGLGVGVQMLLWPTYARITPGRLDIMRYRLGSRRPTTTTIFLRDARVLAHLDKDTLFVKTNAPGSRWTVLNLRGVWSPMELVHAVLRGAMSTAPTPPLPEDELIG